MFYMFSWMGKNRMILAKKKKFIDEKNLPLRASIQSLCSWLKIVYSMQLADQARQTPAWNLEIFSKFFHIIKSDSHVCLVFCLEEKYIKKQIKILYKTRLIMMSLFVSVVYYVAQKWHSHLGSVLLIWLPFNKQMQPNRNTVSYLCTISFQRSLTISLETWICKQTKVG